MRWLVTAAYADQSQVYETEIEADTVEEAEAAAQRQCLKDNGWGEGDEVTETEYPLIDVFARPAPPAAEEIVRWLVRWREFDGNAAVNGMNEDNIKRCAEDLERFLRPRIPA